MRPLTQVTALSVAVALTGGTLACSNDAGEVEDLQAELVEVTSERDELQARLDEDAERYDKTVEVKDSIRAILDDPTSYGTENEVVDLLASYASPNAQMRDDVFGDVRMRAAWHNTLYGDAMDAEIDIVQRWIAPDGSQSGGLWVWHGTNPGGNAFELIGIQIDTHDGNGIVTDEWVAYPYPNDYVTDAIWGDGTPVTGIWPD